jgi:hypothetical protein
MLSSFLMFGERKGIFTAVRKQANPLTTERVPVLETEVNAICQSLDDPWPSKVVQLGPSTPIIDDEDEKVSLYLKNIEMLWQLGSRSWAPIAGKDPLPFNPALLKKTDELHLSVRSANSLKYDDEVVYVGDLAQKTEAELVRLLQMGRVALSEIKDLLERMGLHLGWKYLIGHPRTSKYWPSGMRITTRSGGHA